MKSSFVLTFSILLQIVEILGARISQKKCEFYRNTFHRNGFPFIVRVYSGSAYINGILISENFVLTTANHRLEKLPVIVEALEMRFDVVDKFKNEKQNIILLQLNKSIELNNQIYPVCLPKAPFSPSSNSPPKLIEVCWAKGDWLHEFSLNIKSYTSCPKNTGYYNKEIYIHGVEDGTSVCVHREVGNERNCNQLGATLLNEQQEILSIATGTSDRNTQIFVKVSDHVLWIENIVWPERNDRCTTERASTENSENEIGIESTQIDIISTTSTPTSDEKILLQGIGDELHEIHIFLNVNLVVIVLILLLVLCISCILWSDGLCIRAVLPDQSSISTDV